MDESGGSGHRFSFAYAIMAPAGLTLFFRSATVKPTLAMRHKLQYVPVALLVRLIGALPRPMARGCGMLLGGVVYHLHRRLRRVGMRNLELAFPEKSAKERRQILRGVYVSLGRLLGEACLFPSYTRENASRGCRVPGHREFRSRRKARQGCAFPHRPLRRVGDRFIFPLAAGTSDENRGAATRQSLTWTP